jgi:hypothetical protein
VHAWLPRLLYEALLGSCASGGDALCTCELLGSAEQIKAACEVHCAACEVVRARDATHSAVALRSAATAGDTESRNGCQEAGEVQGSMWCQSPRSGQRTGVVAHDGEDPPSIGVG